MSRALSIGNGNILVNLDDFGRVRDLYFPYIGLENQVGGRFLHRIGVFADERTSWTHENDWRVVVDMEDDALIGSTQAVNEQLGVSLTFSDLVYNEKNIFVRKVVVRNTSDRTRPLKIFFGQQFEIAESHAAHTAYFDPGSHAIIHYRNQRAFLINAQLDGRPFEDYSTGVFGAEGKEGTHVDAVDGRLSQNPIEHGQADSFLGLNAHYGPGEEKIVYYWLAAGFSIEEALQLNEYVVGVGAGHMLETTRNFWRAWVKRQNFNFYGLDKGTVELFNKSLLIVRTHADRGGGIIASGDSDTLQKGKDTYNYVWPRDAALSALALARAGDISVSRRFFSFASQALGRRDYFLHKYSPDKSLGSSWHPWIVNGEARLPIQEDETALVLWSLCRYYEVSKDLEFIEDLYNPLIKRLADFMVLYRDQKTGLPQPSYNLWEERYGISTFTSASVYGALISAANFAGILGKVKHEHLYRKTAEEIKTAITTHLYDESRGVFYNLINISANELNFDTTIDASSVYGVYNFGVLPITDERVARAVKETENALSCRAGIGGIARYQGDEFHRGAAGFPGNPWFVTTLWLAQYYIKTAKSPADLEIVKKWFEWVGKFAQPSGILSEQLHPLSGAQLSVAPLVWSHAELISTVIDYLDKLEEFGVCKACNPVS